MSHFVRDSSRYGPGLAPGVMVQSKARWGDLKRDKYVRMSFYTWLQPDFSSDISAEKEFLYRKHQPLLPAIMLVVRL